MGNHAGRKYLDGEWNGLTITAEKIGGSPTTHLCGVALEIHKVFLRFHSKFAT